MWRIRKEKESRFLPWSTKWLLIPFSDKRKIRRNMGWNSLITLFTGYIIFEMSMRNPNEKVRSDLSCLACFGDMHEKHQLLNTTQGHETGVIPQRDREEKKF